MNRASALCIRRDIEAVFSELSVILLDLRTEAIRDEADDIVEAVSESRLYVLTALDAARLLTERSEV